jgi:hypothetical protein
MEFYKIVSQIIPLLILGVSIQSTFVVNRVKYKSTENFQRNIHLITFVAGIILLILGEFVSLRSVYFTREDTHDLFLVCISMGFGILWIILDFILSLIDKEKEMYLLLFLILGIILEAILLFS